MGKSCILTDDAAQFSKSTFPGLKDIKFIKYPIQAPSWSGFQLHETAFTNSRQNNPHLILPSEEIISSLIVDNYQLFDDIFIILVSNGLFPCFSNVEQIASRFHGRAAIHLIDSQSIALGEGQLVQHASELLHQGYSGHQVEEILRSKIPHVFTLFSIPSFSYLHQNGFLDLGQSITGEMLSLFPIFSLEEGLLNPLEKVKNIKNILDYYIEFIDEFEDINSISLIHPGILTSTDQKLIKLYIEENHPGAQFSEHKPNPFLEALFGPRSLGITIVENH